MADMPTTPSDDAQRAEAQRLLDQHLPMLQGYLRHLLVSAQDADDVAQDVCLEVLATPGILLRGHDPGAYLRGIARHLGRRHRRRYRSHHILDDLVDRAWSEPEEAVDLSRERDALGQCLGQLNDRVRHMVQLRYEEGLNAGEIGQRFELSADAVRMALMRGRQLLGRCLERRLGGKVEL